LRAGWARARARATGVRGVLIIRLVLFESGLGQGQGHRGVLIIRLFVGWERGWAPSPGPPHPKTPPVLLLIHPPLDPCWPWPGASPGTRSHNKTSLIIVGVAWERERERAILGREAGRQAGRQGGREAGRSRHSIVGSGGRRRRGAQEGGQDEACLRFDSVDSYPHTILTTQHTPDMAMVTRRRSLAIAVACVAWCLALCSAFRGPSVGLTRHRSVSVVRPAGGRIPRAFSGARTEEDAANCGRGGRCSSSQLALAKAASPSEETKEGGRGRRGVRAIAAAAMRLARRVDKRFSLRTKVAASVLALCLILAPATGLTSKLPAMPRPDYSVFTAAPPVTSTAASVPSKKPAPRRARVSASRAPTVATAPPSTQNEKAVKAVLCKQWGMVCGGAKVIAQDFGRQVGGGRRDFLLIMLASALITPLSKRVGLSPILGFLAMGTLIGPNFLGMVSDVHAIELVGEAGIIFFLFEMGLELSIERLKGLRRDVLGLGLFQFVLTGFGVAAVASAAGMTGPSLFVIGGGLALSSSAFVLQLLKERDDMGTRYGKASFGILLLQDLAVVPLLVTIPLLTGGGSISQALVAALAKTIFAASLIVILGKTVLERTFQFVSDSKSQEAFLAVIIVTVMGMSTLTEGLGLSNTLGAFLAGVVVSETKYKYTVEAEVAPFRALLLGCFFTTVGFEIDLALVLYNLPLVASLVLGLLSLKAAAVTLICLINGLSLANAQQTGLLLSQGGEFAFVAFGMAERLGILQPALTKLLLTTVALSMATTPYLSEYSAWLADLIEDKMGYSHFVGLDRETKDLQLASDFVLVIGYGRIGQLICALLDKKFIKYVVFEMDQAKATIARKKGLPVFFVDGSKAEILRRFNIVKAKAIISTISDTTEANRSVISIRKELPEIAIIARAKDEMHKKRLQGTLNVKALIPILPEESILYSLPFGGAVLEELGMPSDEVSQLLQEKRITFLQDLGLYKIDPQDIEGAQVGVQGQVEKPEQIEVEVAPESPDEGDVGDVDSEVEDDEVKYMG
jgi:CPA2 family monovalent cation:H+ antiporter-2